MSTVRLHLNLLGLFRLHQGDQPVAGFDRARLQHLLAYLVSRRPDLAAATRFLFLAGLHGSASAQELAHTAHPAPPCTAGCEPVHRRHSRHHPVVPRCALHAGCGRKRLRHSSGPTAAKIAQGVEAFMGISPVDVSAASRIPESELKVEGRGRRTTPTSSLE